MKKILSIFFLLSLIALSACGSNENGGASNEELIFWSYISPTNPDGELLEEMIDDYNESHDGKNVKHEYIPHGDYHQQLSTAVAGDSLPDILILDNPDHARYASMGVLADLTDEIDEWGEKENFLEGPWDSTVYEGKNFGVPFYSNALAMFYNKDIFKENGIDNPPETWEELKEESTKLTQGSTFGFAMAGTSGPEGLFHFLPFLLSTGANYDKLDSPEAAEAFEFLAGLIEDGSMNSEMLNWGQGDVLNQFSAGNAAMMVNGPWQISSLEEQSPDLNFGIALLPKDEKFASVLGGENFAVPKGDSEDAAWEFVKWMTEAEQMEKFTVESGQFPSRTDVAESNDHWEKDAHLSVFLEAVEKAQPRGPHPEWNKIAETIQNSVQNALTGSLTPEKAAEEAANQVTDLLEK
ncbi:ABC transporter substrate-binding protein [Oceanobacillus damuensis]|uniref:ABC transporter substrate-binding protein n=1 Tax=Oceanobacillus damuensis TaxID=937928 RepID=UPI0008366EF4|nr:ABC transporter substrate-binding protein [Oceanobacillus damuensis]